MRLIPKTFARFEQLIGETGIAEKISNRVKMLIKNMLDNRESGWEKSKKQNESGPMKVDDLRRQLELKQREEEAIRIAAEREEYSYLESQGGGRLRGGGGRYNDKYNQGSGQYQEKGKPKLGATQSAPVGGKRDDRGAKGYRDSGRTVEYKPKASAP